MPSTVITLVTISVMYRAFYVGLCTSRWIRPHTYTYAMADDSVFDEIQDNTREAGQRLRASLNLIPSQGMLDDGNYREFTKSLRLTQHTYMLG
jgi:hypothetical protein